MHLAAAVLAPTLKGIAALAALPFAAVHSITPSWLEITCFYGLLWTLSYLIFRRDQPHGAGYATTRRPGSDCNGLPVPGLKNARHRKMATAGLIIVLAVAGIDALYWVHQRFWRDDLRISVLDVGQGSAAVVEFPQGYTMLIDGGGFFDNSVFDVGQRIVAPFLWQKKIRTVDTLVLTHPNSDHLNGLLFIADHFHVRQVWSNGETHTTQGYRMFEEIIAYRNIHRPELSDLLRGRSINGVSIDILYPPRDYLQRRAKESWRSLNNNSLVLRIRIGRHAFLFPGDISKRAEKELVDLAGEHLKSAVLCVPHHGSASSSGIEFIEAVAPRIGVFCVGWQNRFKFPNLHVIERYRRRGVDLLRTDRDGAIEFVTDGRRLSLSTYLTGQQRVSPARTGFDQNDS
jgi:competence protein ComEC